MNLISPPSGSIPGSGQAYSSYDNTKQFSGAAMLAASFTSPTAAPQYSAAAAYYSQPNTSIAYGQVHVTLVLCVLELQVSQHYQVGLR